MSVCVCVCVCMCVCVSSQEIQTEEDTSEPKWTQNANLGRFTNFVNLLDMCGVAVPAGTLHLDADAAETEVRAA